MIKFILWVSSVIPLWLNHRIGALIGRILYFFNTESKRVSAKNIAICFPDLSELEQQNLLKKSLIEMGKGLTELGFIWFNSFEDNSKYISKTVGTEHLDSKQAIILLVPHFACWEIIVRVLSLTQPITCLYKPLTNKKQENLLMAFRERDNIKMASTDKKGVIKLQRALNNKEMIGILPDQYPGKKGGGILAPFFNSDALTMTLLSKLARRNNAKVLMTWAVRLEKAQGYELYLKPVQVLSDSGILKDDVILMNQAIEALVRTRPEQYLWSYKRFKSRIKYS